MTNSDQPAEEEVTFIQAEQDEYVAFKNTPKIAFWRGTNGCTRPD